jgi:hypothetical protein
MMMETRGHHESKQPKRQRQVLQQFYLLYHTAFCYYVDTYIIIVAPLKNANGQEKADCGTRIFKSASIYYMPQASWITLLSIPFLPHGKKRTNIISVGDVDAYAKRLFVAMHSLATIHSPRLIGTNLESKLLLE